MFSIDKQILIGPRHTGRLRAKPYVTCLLCGLGAHWLSGKVLESRPKGPRFKPHRRHCVVSLSKTHLILLSTGSTQEDLSIMTEKKLTGTLRIKQNKHKILCGLPALWSEYTYTEVSSV